jgi:hypothetical protein
MVIEALATNLPAVGAGNDAIEPPIVGFFDDEWRRSGAIVRA